MRGRADAARGGERRREAHGRTEEAGAREVTAHAALAFAADGLNRAGEERRPVEAPKPGQTFALMYVDADENGMNGRTIKVPLPTPQEPTNG